MSSKKFKPPIKKHKKDKDDKIQINDNLNSNIKIDKTIQNELISKINDKQQKVDGIDDQIINYPKKDNDDINLINENLNSQIQIDKTIQNESIININDKEQKVDNVNHNDHQNILDNITIDNIKRKREKDNINDLRDYNS